MAAAIFSLFRLDCQELSPQALYDQAGRALDAGNAELAIRLYEELLRQAPDSMEARTNLGVAFAQEGRYEEAAQQYRQVLSRDSRNQTAMLNLALAYYKQGDFGKARNLLEVLHQLRPANRQAFDLLSDCDLRLGMFRDAIALVEPAYQAQPDDPAIEYILGTALIQDGQTQKGAAVIDRMMRNGNSAVASVLMGASQFAAGEYKTSAATLRKALDLNPKLPAAWTIYGRALLSNGENEEAKRAFRRALEADPNDFDACLHLGALLRHDGDTAGAEPYLRHALVLRPESAAALFQVCALDAATGHLEEAKTGFQKLVKQWPDFVEAHLQLALLYARLHQTQDSERERRIVVELNEKARSKGPQPEVVP
ncbi:MAG TPA: tetratricopeptide repeat protein [Bryobacteraceae bacterium]|nr:tetratricopeptide repeat protein [Bryobacteraceae bacterium]